MIEVFINVICEFKESNDGEKDSDFPSYDTTLHICNEFATKAYCGYKMTPEDTTCIANIDVIDCPKCEEAILKINKIIKPSKKEIKDSINF